MTWMPIWLKCNTTLISPLIVPALSYGFFNFICQPKPVDPSSSCECDKEEMIRWSGSLSDPDNPNYNPFTFTNK